MTRDLHRARLLALALPAALLAGAWGSQLWGGLYPCEMCHWQRWPHYGALALATAAFVLPGARARRTAVLLAALAVAVSGALGVYHAGVEYGWWQGATGCTSLVRPTGNAQDMLDQLMRAPMIRCDVPQWTLAGVSLAGWNAIISLGGALVIVLLAGRRGDERAQRD